MKSRSLQITLPHTSGFPLKLREMHLPPFRTKLKMSSTLERYLDISRTPYTKVWYKLHSCPDARKWPSILDLCDLAFSLPFSNGRVKQIFSSLKVVKTIRRTNLQGDTLNDHLDIYIEGPTLSLFCPNRAIELWWSDCSTTRQCYCYTNLLVTIDFVCNV